MEWNGQLPHKEKGNAPCLGGRQNWLTAAALNLPPPLPPKGGKVTALLANQCVLEGSWGQLLLT